MQNPLLGFSFFFLGFHLLQQLLSLVPKHVQGVVKRYDALSELLVSYSKYFHVFIITMFDVLHLTALHHLNDLQIFYLRFKSCPCFFRRGIVKLKFQSFLCLMWTYHFLIPRRSLPLSVFSLKHWQQCAGREFM